MLWVNIELHIQYTHFWISIVHVSRLVDAHIYQTPCHSIHYSQLDISGTDEMSHRTEEKFISSLQDSAFRIVGMVTTCALSTASLSLGKFSVCVCVCVLAVATFNTCRSAYLFDMFEHQRSLRAVLSEPAVIQAQLFRIAFVIMWYRVRIESSSSQNIQTHRAIA